MGKNARPRSKVQKMLAEGAARRGFELLRREVLEAADNRVADFVRNVRRARGNPSDPGPQEYAETLNALRKATGGRSLASLLKDGPLPARMPRPRDAPGTAGVQAPAEPLPTEFKALAEAKVLRNGTLVPAITEAVHAAAGRLGFTLPALYRRLYPALERLRLKRKAKSREGQRWTMDGRIAELALHRSPAVLSAEERAIDAALESMGPPAPRVPPPTPSPPSRPRTPEEVSAANAVLAIIRQPGVFDIELTDVRDSAGQLVTDRFRGLLDLRKQPPEFVIVAIGESKTAGGASDILPQLVQDVRRLLKGFRAPLAGAGTRFDFDGTRVRFGPQLVVSWLSEKNPPERLRKSLEGKLARLLGGSRRKPPQITPVPIDPGTAFQDARVVASGLQTALQALATGGGKR